MSEYINRQLAMNAFAERVKRSNNSDFAPVPRWNDAVEIVENLPSADVVEVVRCKDCRYFNKAFPLIHLCNVSGMKMDADDFCSCGEQKDG